MVTPEAFRMNGKGRELYRFQDVPGEENHGWDRKSSIAKSASSADPPVIARYLISRYTIRGLEPFCLSSESGTEVLPVFPSKKIAVDFLRVYVTEEGWYVREFSAGELISVLYGPGANVEEVLIYPLMKGEPVRAVRKGSFVDDLLVSRSRSKQPGTF